MKFANTTKRILWVDDDVLILDKQRDLVVKSGWPLTTISDASEAFKLFKGNDTVYRGVLLDTMMDPVLEIGPHHFSGILTGLLIAKRAIGEGFLDPKKVVFLTNCKQHIFLRMANEMGIPVHQKSRYHGRALASLIEKVFHE